jgi:hypothetical protein
MKVGLGVMDENPTPCSSSGRRTALTCTRPGQSTTTTGAASPARRVFGTPEDVAGQLRRYDAVGWALLYPPHFGVDADRVHANELSLIEAASGWTS